MEKILIVEDDADLVETYTDLLETHHHLVTSAPKALDAIKIVTRFKPNIVLLDLKRKSLLSRGIQNCSITVEVLHGLISFLVNLSLTSNY
jgi:DNA-binding response OmpR family regulator